VEAVGQLVASSSDSRIAVVTGDELLTQAIAIRTNANQNVHVLSSIEELEGLINTLVSNVDEVFIERMKAAAKAFFYDPETRQGYIYEHKIRDRILREFQKRIFEIPAGANEVERGKTLVSNPRFKEKKVNRMYWVSRVAFRMKAYSDEPTMLGNNIADVSLPAFGVSGYSGYSAFSGYSPITDDASTSEDIESGDIPKVITLGPPVSYKLSTVTTSCPDWVTRCQQLWCLSSLCELLEGWVPGDVEFLPANWCTHAP